MDTARKLNVSLLTVSVSQSGVLSLFPARNQFAPYWALVRRPLPDCCFTLFVDETSKPSDFASYVVELATIVVAAVVSLL